MPSGGKRKGAGRRPGALTQKTRAIAEAAVEEGITPLEVMLKAMRFHAFAGNWSGAAEVAKNAAPYLHPKLSSIEHSAKDGGPLGGGVEINVHFVEPSGAA